MLVFRQILIILILISIGCATGTSVSHNRSTASVDDGMDTVTLESMSARKLSSNSCEIDLPKTFYVDPTFLLNSSKFELIDVQNRKFGEMERQGSNLTSKFVIKDIHTSRILGTAISNGQSSNIPIFDCENVMFGSLQEQFRKGKVSFLVANKKKIVQFAAESVDPLASEFSLKATDGKEVFHLSRFSENDREKWKVQITDLGSVDPKFILFFLSYKSFIDDKRRSD